MTGIMTGGLRGTTGFLWFVVVSCAFVAVAAIVSPWPLTLVEHFRVQHVVIGIVVAGVCMLHRRGRWLARVDVVLLATLTHLLWLVPDLTAARRPLPAGSSLRVMLLNVHMSGTSYTSVRRLIDDVAPDVIALIETDARWLRALVPSLASFSSFEYPASNGFGLALDTRGPLHPQVRFLGVFPSIVGTFEHAGRSISIIVTHPVPQVLRKTITMHEQQLARVGAYARSMTAPTLILGDLNTTPWSAEFRRLVEVGGLCDTRAGFGLQATFPAWLFAMRIPLDHVLVSCSVGVRDRRVERDVGSDHLPVVVDLVVP
jgi:endonuclease/exonuclease/phosphatase (EEP) superfamily protein YafD